MVREIVAIAAISGFYTAAVASADTAASSRDRLRTLDSMSDVQDRIESCSDGH